MYGRLEASLPGHRKERRLAEIMDVCSTMARGWVTGMWGRALTQAIDGDRVKKHGLPFRCGR